MDKEILDFINKHQKKAAADVALLLSKLKHLPKDFILNQINGRQKAKKKFPFLSNHIGFVFASPRAVSQSSSESTALYKANLISGIKLVDLTGGMGIDSYFFSKHFDRVDYVEANQKLAQLTQENIECLGCNNIVIHNSNAEQFLQETKSIFDLVYIDPDRRVLKDKAFRIDDCEPNVAQLLPLIWQRSNSCLIKLSPMLDVTQALSEFDNCKEVHIVSVDNECKELLFLLQKDYTSTVVIKTINLKKENKEEFQFSVEEESNSNSEFSTPLNYLYEANSSVLKAGAFKSIAAKFNLKKLAINTHLYTSTELVENFPGRSLKINRISKPNSKLLAKANIISRNFPLKPDQIKKKYKFKDGGDQYLYACSLANNDKVFICCELV